MDNKINLKFLSISENESFARNVIASFILPLNPTLAEINDVKTAVSEAVTNAIVHGYLNKMGIVELEAEIKDKTLHIVVKDNGVGIENVEKAIEPIFTTQKKDERSGMGFTIMKTFMDDLKVKSSLNEGTIITMTKTIGNNL